jgi:hypothetical protein
MDDIPRALREIIDRAAIELLLHDYCHHLDRMELEELAGLFTPDCRVEYGPDQRLKAVGRAELELSLARMWRWRRTAHHLSNLRLWFDGEAVAHGESYVLAWHEAADGSAVTAYGRYIDTFRRSDQGWRISTRRMEMNGADAGFRVAIPQSERREPPDDWQSPIGMDD